MQLRQLALTVILTTILVNCGTNKTKVENAYQAPEVAPYVEMLAADLNSQKLSFNVTGVAVIMTENLDADKLGQASFAGNKLTIYLNAEYWPKLTELGKKELIYHEFGHIIGLKHNSSLDAQGRPVSIMYPYNLSLFATYYFESNSAALFNNLFVELQHVR